MATKTFLDLFTVQQRAVLEQDVDVEQFFNLIDTKNKLPLSDITSPEDKMEAQLLIQNFEENNKNKIM